MSKDYEFKIQSFAPDEDLTDDVSKMYMDMLDNLMKNKQVRNIAMTGDLGIGKSTLIRNYERKYPKSFSRKKYVYLSVTDMKVKSAGEALQNELEERLLKQLLVICNKEEMIGSHYRPVPEKNVGAIPYILAAIAILLIAWALGILPYASEYTYINIGAAVLAAIPLFYLFYKICKHYKLPSFEFNFGGEKNNGNAAAEHTEAEETLDKNMTDIVYLMERIYKKSAKVLVVEDLDRYGADICIPIIEKFREINVLVNQRIRFLHGDKEPFRFVYILKDDIFSQMMQDKNKPSASQYDIFSEMPQDENKSSVPPSKYFDGILPVVPQLGHANSADYLIGKREWNTKYNIEEDFIYDVSKYIYDYRQIRAIENEFNIFREVAEDKIKDESKINATELMAFCIYKHFYPEEYYKIRTQPEQELISYVFEKEIHDITTDASEYFIKNTIISNEVKLPTDDRKKTLFNKITIDILRYLFPDNSINNVLVEFDKLAKNITLENVLKIEKQLHKSSAYYIDFRLILAIYAAICTSEDSSKNEKIFEFQKKLMNECDENAKNASCDNAKEKFAFYYAMSLVNATVGITDSPERIRLAEKIKTEIFDKYQTPEIAEAYAMALANATCEMTDSRKIEDIAEKIKTEILEKYQTPEIANQYAMALVNATAKMTDSDKIQEKAEIINELLEKYQTPEIALQYAMALVNATIGITDSDKIQEKVDIINELLEKYQTPEIALRYAMALVNATIGITDSDKIQEKAEIIKKLLEKYQTPEIAHCYSAALGNATNIMTDSGKIQEKAEIIKELLEKYQTPKIALEYANALVNATYEMTDTKKIEDIAEKIKTELLAFEKYQTPEIALEYAIALVNATVKIQDATKIVDIAEKIKTEILEKYQTPEIALEYAKTLVNATYEMTDSDKIQEKAEIINELLEKYQTPEIALQYAMALVNAAFKMTDTKKIVDIAKKIKTKILEKYQTPEIVNQYAKALAIVTDKIESAEICETIADNFKNEYLSQEKYQTQEIYENYGMILNNIAESMETSGEILNIADRYYSEILINETYRIDKIEMIYTNILNLAAKKIPDSINASEIQERIRYSELNEKFERLLNELNDPKIISEKYGTNITQ